MARSYHPLFLPGIQVGVPGIAWSIFFCVVAENTSLHPLRKWVGDHFILPFFLIFLFLFFVYLVDARMRANTQRTARGA